MSFILRNVRYFSPRSALLFIRNDKNPLILQCKTFKTNTKMQKPNSRWKIFGLASIIGVGIGVVYSYRKIESSRYAILNPGTGEKTRMLKELPNIDISRKVSAIFLFLIKYFWSFVTTFLSHT